MATLPRRTGRFEFEKLPPVRSFYESAFGELGRPNRRGWAVVLAGCPFHPSKSKRSFFVNLESGGFYCHSCGAKGGGIVAFVRLRDRCDFKTACCTLGCWRDGARPRRVPTRPVCYLRFDFAIDGQSYRAEVLDEPRTFRAGLRHFFWQARDRLIEIQNGDGEAFEHESQTQWSIMTAAWELLEQEERDDDWHRSSIQ